MEVTVCHTLPICFVYVCEHVRMYVCVCVCVCVCVYMCMCVCDARLHFHTARRMDSQSMPHIAGLPSRLSVRVREKEREKKTDRTGERE